MQWNEIERLWGETAQRMQPGFGAALLSPLSGFAVPGDGFEEAASPSAPQVQGLGSAQPRTLSGR